MEVIRERFAEALRNQKTGEELAFPLEKYTTIRVTLHRLGIEMWENRPVWEKPRIVSEKGVVIVKRIK